MKTIRNVSPISRNAAINATAAATTNTVRIGNRSSTRLDSCDVILRNLWPAAVGALAVVDGLPGLKEHLKRKDDRAADQAGGRRLFWT